MSWSYESHARELLSRERTLFTPARGGRTGICLAYPNHYSLGMGNLGWMLLLGALMALEKNVAWGRRLSTPLGVGLLGWAAALVLTHA